MVSLLAASCSTFSFGERSMTKRSELASLPLDVQKRVLRRCERKAMRTWGFWWPFIVFPIAGGAVGRVLQAFIPDSVPVFGQNSRFLGTVLGVSLAGFLSMQLSDQFIDEVLADEESKEASATQGHASGNTEPGVGADSR